MSDATPNMAFIAHLWMYTFLGKRKYEVSFLHLGSAGRLKDWQSRDSLKLLALSQATPPDVGVVSYSHLSTNVQIRVSQLIVPGVKRNENVRLKSFAITG